MTNATEPALFKDWFDAARATALAEQIAAVYAPFDHERFVALATTGLEALELKQRVAHFSAALHATLPADYPDALEVLLAALGPELGDPEAGLTQSMFHWPFAHFVETYGLEHRHPSLAAMHEITRRFSCEFAIRPFLERYPEETLQKLHDWAVDPNEHVRRLVSEGTRTRLPWGRRLRQFVQDPQPVLALLELLRNDPSLYVRRSVANNLNDILKDNRDAGIAVLKRWHRDPGPDTPWVLRHALRSLVKAGDPEALSLLGFRAEGVVVNGIRLEPTEITLGEPMQLGFELRNGGSSPARVVVDYAIHFVRKDGGRNRKVFKLRNIDLAPGATMPIQKRILLKPITTRRYYSGEHELDIQVNGKVLAAIPFTLVV